MAGGSAEKAIDYARRAGDRAAAVLAHEEAAHHYDRALQAFEQTEAADEARRGELLFALGEAQLRSGETEKASAALLEAAEIARRREDPEQLARVALAFAPGFFAIEFGVFDERRVGLLDEALTALGDRDDALRAQLLGRLAVPSFDEQGP